MITLWLKEHNDGSDRFPAKVDLNEDFIVEFYAAECGTEKAHTIITMATGSQWHVRELPQEIRELIRIHSKR